MNKVKIFHSDFYWKLEKEINEFAEKHNILNTSICTEKHSYTVSYNIIVLYEDK